jgi:hypothetical protein
MANRHAHSRKRTRDDDGDADALAATLLAQLSCQNEQQPQQPPQLQDAVPSASLIAFEVALDHNAILLTKAKGNGHDIYYMYRSAIAVLDNVWVLLSYLSAEERFSSYAIVGEFKNKCFDLFQSFWQDCENDAVLAVGVQPLHEQVLNQWKIISQWIKGIPHLASASASAGGRSPGPTPASAFTSAPLASASASTAGSAIAFASSTASGARSSVFASVSSSPAPSLALAPVPAGSALAFAPAVSAPVPVSAFVAVSASASVAASAPAGRSSASITLASAHNSRKMGVCSRSERCLRFVHIFQETLKILPAGTKLSLQLEVDLAKDGLVTRRIADDGTLDLGAPPPPHSVSSSSTQKRNRPSTSSHPPHEVQADEDKEIIDILRRFVRPPHGQGL